MLNNLIEIQELLEIIARNLKEFREDNDYKQHEVAKYLNISRSTYANWEKADCFPSLSSLDKITLFYNISLDCLLRKKRIKSYKEKLKPMNYNILLNNLKELRNKNKYPLRFVARYCYTSLTNYNKIEHGKYEIKIYYLVKIMKLYNISADEITGKIKS